jgi:hypothetical protein
MQEIIVFLGNVGLKIDSLLEQVNKTCVISGKLIKGK